MRPFESMTNSELVIAAYDETKDYDYRILAHEEIYRRAGVTDGNGLHKPDGRYI
ncbi:hypothetical protein NYE46_07605 [Listeria sp. FSL L8-0308]|nr:MULTISPECIES: hypothetical protein [Paenibacillus]KAF6576546.1 hypothetical protein G9G53_01145 [Paenibacillus sp. EKM206P]KAF6591320.1 hypothetical protein G9G52_02820 [Paenibacillus sp. EKM205P]